MEDYSKYEGKIVKLINSQCNGFYIVEGCDYDIGITITKVGDKDYHYLCLAGPSSPIFKDMFDNEAQYKEFFDFQIQEIKNGICNAEKSIGEFRKTLVKYVEEGRYLLGPQAECSFKL